MSVITIKSEHQYDVVIGNSWLPELIESVAKYSRIAVFFSQSQKESIPQIYADAELHYFPL
jgi:hypothetical protein